MTSGVATGTAEKLFDPATGYLWGKREDGTWSGAHDDPTDFGKDFVEADAAQSLWGAPHDLDGYVTRFGTKEKRVAKLSELFG